MLKSGAIIKRINFPLKFDQNINGTITEKYNIAVPKSGCLKTIRGGIVAKTKIRIIYNEKLSLTLLSAKNLDKHIMYIILPNSDGCR